MTASKRPTAGSAKKHLDNWLDQHGYRHEHARKQKTPPPYGALSSRATAEKVLWNLYSADGRWAGDVLADNAKEATRLGGRGVKSAQRVESYVVSPRMSHARKPTERLPFSTRKCYACDAEAIGVRDRRPEGGMIEAACARHADPTIKAFPACAICGGHIRPTSYDVDGTFVHKACHAEDLRS
jgi:hypothetical protein